MKINTMNLIAYGPFTDLKLDFSDKSALFHIVYGPNEAGKSSALRALRRMLFGIPVQTGDSFLHPNPKLRIGARLTSSNGKKIEFIRRKGQSKTLRGPDGQSLLDDNALAPFLGGVDQDLFEQMFAIGHEDLVKGGEEIISGGGRVGQALFAAGAGLIKLQSFRQSLDQECEALFKPSGSKPRINHCVSLLKTIRKNQKNALLMVKTWKSHHQALGDAQQRLNNIRQHQAQLQQKSGRLDRIRRALPLIARKKEVDAQLLAHEGVPELPENFGKMRQKIENDLTIATNDFNRVTDTIKGISEQIKTLSVPKEILHHAEMIELLQQELGKYSSAQKDRPNLAGRMRTLQKQASDKLSEIGADALSTLGEDLRLAPSVVGEIQDMGKTFERLTTRLEDMQGSFRKIQTQISMLTHEKKALTVPPDITALKIVLQTVQEEGPIEKQLSETRTAIESNEKTLDKALQRQSLWFGSLEDLETQVFPSRESIDQFEDRLTACLRKIETFEEETRNTDVETAKIEIELNAIELSHDVPTEEDLEKARHLRENGWNLIKGKLSGKTLPSADVQAYLGQFDSPSSLADTFEISLAQADHIADRLRREAEQVSKKSLLEASRQQLEKKQQDLIKALKALHKTHTAIGEEWKQTWEPAAIQPLTPKEMGPWLLEIKSIREKLADINSEKIKADGMALEMESLKAELFDSLAKAQKVTDKTFSLSKMARIARLYVETQETLKSKTESIEKDLLNYRKKEEETRADLAGLENELGQWKTRWGKIVEKIGLDAQASPGAAVVVLDSIREAKGLMDEADVLGKRIKGIDRDADTFKQQVDHLVDNLASEFKDDPPDRAAVMLNARLTKARESLSKQKSLEKQLSKAKNESHKAEKRIADTTTLLDSMCREAHCDRPEDLEAMEKRSTNRQQRIRERTEIEARLRDYSAGATVEAFIAEAELVDADTIAPELERMAYEIKTMEQERSDLDQTIGTEKAELKRMDGSAQAAGYAEEAERLLASLESDTEQYARLKIAAVILTRTIEQYREKHQGPLIKRASHLFSQMTLGSFEGIRAEYDEKGNPVLVGTRPGSGEQVTVAGMSDGTADQLYLALRLAGLEQFLEKNEPLPFVVDDILLRFDDDRAVATLKVLSDLSEKTQVIFFTHHDHLVQLAENSIQKNKLLRHTIT